MAFDETRAYHGDHQYIGRIVGVSWEHPGEDGTVEITDGLKARFDTITSDLITVAASLGLPSHAAAVVVWEPKATDIETEDWEPILAPQFGHVLRKEPNTIEPEAVGEGWVIEWARESACRGKWVCLCRREAVNA
jgi:hypothetical protein